MLCLKGLCCTPVHDKASLKQAAWPCDAIAHRFLLQGSVVRRLLLPVFLHHCRAHMHDAYIMQNRRQNLYPIHACFI